MSTYADILAYKNKISTTYDFWAFWKELDNFFNLVNINISEIAKRCIKQFLAFKFNFIRNNLYRWLLTKNIVKNKKCQKWECYYFFKIIMDVVCHYRCDIPFKMTYKSFFYQKNLCDL